MYEGSNEGGSEGGQCKFHRQLCNCPVEKLRK